MASIGSSTSQVSIDDAAQQRLDKEALQISYYNKSIAWAKSLSKLSKADDNILLDIDELETEYNDGYDLDSPTEDMAEEADDIDEKEENTDNVDGMSLVQNLKISNANGILAQINRRANESGILDTEIQRILEETLPIVEAFKKEWREAGIERVLNTFDLEKIEDKVGSWMRRNSSNAYRKLSISPYSKFEPYQHKKTRGDYDSCSSDSLHSIDTARYIRSCRKLRNVQKQIKTTTTTIKSYRLIESKRNELRRKYDCLATDDSMNLLTLKHRRPMEYRVRADCINDFRKTDKIRLCQQSHRIRKLHYRWWGNKQNTSYSSSDDGYEQNCFNARTCLCAMCHCEKIGALLPYRRETECSCRESDKLCNNARHLANSSAEDWLVENLESPKRIVQNCEQMGMRTHKNKRAIAEKTNCTKNVKMQKIEQEAPEKKSSDEKKLNKNPVKTTNRSKKKVTEEDSGDDFENELQEAIRLSKLQYEKELKAQAQKKIFKTDSLKQRDFNCCEQTNDLEKKELKDLMQQKMDNQYNQIGDQSNNTLLKKVETNKNDQINTQIMNSKATSFSCQIFENKNSNNQLTVQSQAKEKTKNRMRTKNSKAKSQSNEGSENKKCNNHSLEKVKSKENVKDRTGKDNSKAKSFSEDENSNNKWSIQPQAKDNTKNGIGKINSKAQSDSNEASDNIDSRNQLTRKVKAKEIVKDCTEKNNSNTNIYSKQESRDENSNNLISTKPEAKKNMKTEKGSIYTKSNNHSSTIPLASINSQQGKIGILQSDENSNQNLKIHTISSPSSALSVEGIRNTAKTKCRKNRIQISDSSMEGIPTIAKIKNKNTKSKILTSIKELCSDDGDSDLISNEQNINLGYLNEIHASNIPTENTTFFGNSGKICNSTALINNTAICRQMVSTHSMHTSTHVDLIKKNGISGSNQLTLTTSTIKQMRSIDINKKGIINKNTQNSTYVVNSIENHKRSLQENHITSNQNNDCTLISSTTDNDLKQSNKQKGTNHRIVLYTPKNRSLIPENSFVNGRIRITEDHLASFIGNTKASKFMKYYFGPLEFKESSTIYYKPPNEDEENFSSDSETDVIDMCLKYGQLIESKGKIRK